MATKPKSKKPSTPKPKSPKRKRLAKKNPNAYPMEVLVELSLEDWKDRAQELAGIQAQLAEIDQKLADAKDAAKEAKGEHAPRITALWAMLDSGKESRELEVEDRRDLEAGKIRTIHLDTGAEVACRDMSDAERQADMDLDGHMA